MRPLRVVLALSLVLVLVTGAAAQAPITLWINGRQVVSDVPPVIVQDRVMVPLRLVSEQLDAEVSWDGASRTVTVTSRGMTWEAYRTGIRPWLDQLLSTSQAFEKILAQRNAGQITDTEAEELYRAIVTWCDKALDTLVTFSASRQGAELHGLLTQTIAAYRAAAEVSAIYHAHLAAGRLTEALALSGALRALATWAFELHRRLETAWKDAATDL